MHETFRNFINGVWDTGPTFENLHPADTESLLAALDGLKASGNSLVVVEHELDVIRRADWIVVTLPTDDRVVGDPRCCCSATAGGRPSMASTSGTAS